MLVILSLAAVQHIAYSFNERDIQDARGITISAADLRLKFIQAALGDADPVMIELSFDQLRVLDMLLTDDDPRSGKLPDGMPVLRLVETIWRAIIGRDIIGVPAFWYKEDDNASITGADENRNPDAAADDDATAVH